MRRPNSLLVVAVIVMLAGCARVSSTGLPSPHRTSSDLEAHERLFESAKSTFLQYEKVGDEIGWMGGAHSERLSPFVSSKELKADMSFFEELSKSGETFTGNSVVTSMELQTISQNMRGRVSIAIHACVDISGTRVLNKARTDITPPNRPSPVPVVVQFVNRRPHSTTIVVDEISPWSGHNFCE